MSLSLFSSRSSNSNNNNNTTPGMVLPTITTVEKEQLKEYSSICLTIRETAKSLAKLRKIKKNKEELEINRILEKINSGRLTLDGLWARVCHSHSLKDTTKHLI